tara:strand:- start:6517 stop:6756 length:240 start_codon:yes stop_codon:yes gene_type:complete
MTDDQSPPVRRRLSDRIVDAFDMACNQGNVEAASGLYQTLEIVLTNQGGADSTDKRRNIDFVHAAAAKLLALKSQQRAA